MFGVLGVLFGVLGILVGVLCVLFGVLGVLFGILGVLVGVLGVFFGVLSFYRTQVYLGSDLWVRVSLSNSLSHLFDASYPTITRSRYFTSPEEFSSSGDVWYDSGEVVSTREK